MFDPYIVFLCVILDDLPVPVFSVAFLTSCFGCGNELKTSVGRT